MTSEKTKRKGYWSKMTTSKVAILRYVGSYTDLSLGSSFILIHAKRLSLTEVLLCQIVHLTILPFLSSQSEHASLKPQLIQLPSSSR